MRPAPTTQAQPVVARSKFAHKINRPLAMTRPHDGRSITPSRAKMLATVRQMLHAMSSLKT